MDDFPRPGSIPSPLGRGGQPGDISALLNDEEQRRINAEKMRKLQRVGEITIKVEDLLLKENVSWEEWGIIIDLMNARSQAVFPTISISEMKERYERLTNPEGASANTSGSSADGGATGKTPQGERGGDDGGTAPRSGGKK